MDQMLVEEGERFMAKRGLRIAPTLRRRFPLLILVVQKPQILLARNEPVGSENRLGFSKAYSHQPEEFLVLMLHLLRFSGNLSSIVRALRENWVITVRDRGRTVKIPINQATNQELVAFIRTRYGTHVDLQTVSKCRQRLALVDAKRPSNDPIGREALDRYSKILASEQKNDKRKMSYPL
jgi:hypothetical protein